MRFDPGGHLHYGIGSGARDTGTWVQNGNDVDMEANGHYADYHGVVQGDAIVGNAHNVTGLHWTWILQREY